MTEDQQPVWVESDGVSNLPTEVGIYKMRNLHEGKLQFSFFNGKYFCKYVYKEREAELPENTGEPTRGFKYGNFDAWWDYQGLMAKPQAKSVPTMDKVLSDEDEEQSIFEAWLDRKRPSGDADQVQYAWLDSDDYADLMDARSERDMRRAAAIMATDEPGITAMAERNKPAPEPEKVVVGGLTIDMADLVEFLKTKQPKPEPNTTPRGILTVWNESADHRLGMWRTME